MPRLFARCQAAWSAFRGAGLLTPTMDEGSITHLSVDITPEIPRYPPFLKGLPVASPTQILATQRELIATLQDALALTDTDYQTLIVPLLEHYAAFVHLLPASETHHHRGAGGLFRHGLETAFQAARASRGKLFALDRRPEERRALEPRWHLAAFIVGLLHDVGKPVTDVAVVDRAGTSRWQPVDESIVAWANREQIDHYFLRWNPQRRHHGHEVFTASVFHQLLTPAVRKWLMDPDPMVWHTLGRVLAGSDTQTLLYQLMHEADRASVAQDLRENRIDPDALSLGVPIERYLIDTMRSLLREGTWTVNVPGAQLWMFHPHGLHLVWSDCAPTLVQRLTDARIPGIPQDPDTLADILIDHHLAVPRSCAGQEHPARYWRLAPALLARDRDHPVELSFLRLSSPELLFSGVVPSPTPLVRPASEILLTAADAGDGASETAPATATRSQADRLPSADVQRDAPEAPPVAHSRTPPSPSHPAPSRTPINASILVPVESPAPISNTSSSPTVDTARLWLNQQAPAGSALVQLSAAIAQGRITLDALPNVVQGKVFLPYPQSLTGLDAPPTAILADLNARQWIACDPLKPMLTVRAHEGVAGVWLTREVSRHLLALGLDGTDVSPSPSTINAVVTDTADPAATFARITPAASLGVVPPVTVASAYARGIRERLLARDPTLGPITESGQALSVALSGPILDGAKRAGISETALSRALERVPGAGPVTKGIFTLGL
ncbi:relaxase [Thiocystis minor]|nr:relaxase [Thiocystis minor]